MTQYPLLSTDHSVKHPLDVFKDEWHVSQQSVHSDDLIVLHDIEPPDELEQLSLSHHVLAFHLSHGSRQITQMDGQKYDGAMPIGKFFLLPAFCPATFSWETTDEAIVFLLKPDFLQRTAAQTECFNLDQVELRPVLIDQDPQIEQFARTFHHEMQTEGLGGRLYAESLANCLVIHLLRHYGVNPAKLRRCEGGLSQARLQLALEVIHASLDQSLRLETVAGELGLDVYYFSRLFRQSMGISPYQYVLQQRVEKAKELLKYDQLSITDISLECGFANPSHLARHFRKIVGISPKIYRRQAR